MSAIATDLENHSHICRSSLGAQCKRWAEHFVGDAAILCGYAGDASIALAALTFSFWIRFQTRFSQYAIPQRALVLGDYAQYIGFGVLTLVGCLAYFGIYNRGLLLHPREVRGRIVRAWLVWLAVFLGCAEILRAQPPISRIFVSFAAALILGGTIGWRWAFHRMLATERIASCLRQRVLFVGWTPEAGRLAELVWQNGTDPCQIVGYVDLPQSSAQATPPANVPYLGEISDLAQICAEQRINIALLTDVNVPGGFIVELSTICEKELVAFKIIPSYFPILVSAMRVETISGTPVLGVDKLPLNRLRNRLIKRTIDILGGTVGLVVAFPLIAIFGTLVYLESPGPIFFSQERIGRKGRRFKMVKIRSMRPDAGASDHLQQSTGRRDARVLRVGALMRRWNIDELPQFWNVLTGEMSLVGPRPERTYHSEQLKEVIPHYNARYISKPGVTGWAQVNGLRGDTDLTERIQHDIFYMEHWSVLFDLRTMLMTFVGNKNAY